VAEVGPGAPSPGWSATTRLAAVTVLLLSAVALFAAGLSLGEGGVGGDPEERAAVRAFVETYRSVSREYVGEVDRSELVEGAIRGMFEALDDPYSAYMGPDEYSSTLAAVSGEFEGIGARMTSEDVAGVACDPLTDDCRLLVVEVLPDTPAERAGLLDGDVVRSVDDQPLAGRTFEAAVALIRGPRGTRVLLGLERGGLPRSITVERDVVRARDVRSEVLADGRVGYIRIDSFSSGVADDFRDSLEEQLGAGITRFVLDVRDDPGGFVDAAVSVASQFVGSGAILWEEDADGSQRPFPAEAGGLATDPEIELVVLVDDGTASASEILAGALRDAGRAVLVGQPTFGKGSVQEWTQLPGDTGGFRLSVARWLTRDRTSVDGSGVQPDILVEPGGRFDPGDDPTTALADPQLARAIAILLDGDPGAAPSPAASPAASPTLPGEGPAGTIPAST
jgi:carboxyl-terminal processing protease